MSRRKKKHGLGAVIAVAVILAVVCVVLIILLLKTDGITGSEKTQPNTTETTDTQEEAAESSKTPEVFADELQITYEEAKTDYNVPKTDKSVAELSSEVNPDIYALVVIPGCKIEEPVCQREDDELYYSSHNAEGQSDDNGCVFTQVFNTKDFTDNLTVMYGRNTGDGKLFSNLHYYEDPQFMEENPYIYVFTDSQVNIYEIFGAYSYDALHLIVGYDTNTEQGYENYQAAISELEPGMNDNFREDTVLEPTDRMLTLSTGITGDDEHRYLVQGILKAKADLN